MTPEADFDQRIVQEVLRRLLDPLLFPNRAAPSTNLVASPTSGIAPEHSSTKQSVMERLITLESVRNLRTAVSQIQVDSRAVVTPAATDELRRLGIAVLRGADGVSASTKRNRQWFLATTCTKFTRPEVTIDALQRDWFQSADLRKVLGECSRVLQGRLSAAVIYAQSPALVACLLNRHSHVRAMVGRGVQRLADDVKACNANALVVDIHQSAAEQWQCVDLFARSLSND
ncbi:MAG: hypothetical protein O2931_07445 [Planctomycetota bacterium]|nr:hypothetical protein [Planctomycetota bacterium]MDA1178615.1 hypothetical protein [Planctomycetota bacterium]